jgi:Replication factor RFC1 C terminal domain
MHPCVCVLTSRVTADRSAVRLDYLPALSRVLTAPLRRDGVAGVEETIAMLDEYGLSRTDLMESMAEFNLKVTTRVRDLLQRGRCAAPTAVCRPLCVDVLWCVCCGGRNRSISVSSARSNVVNACKVWCMCLWLMLLLGKH